MSAGRILAFFALIAGISSTQTSDCSYSGLVNYLNLTNGLLTMIRPVRNWTDPTSVQLDVVIYGILDLDEKAQSLTTHIWTQMYWQSEFLTWNSSDFCGINMLVIPRSILWTPDLTIQEDTSDTGTVQDSPLITLFPEGLVSANRHQRLTSTCQLNLYLFPFDTQHCNITFLSFNYFADGVKLGCNQSGTSLTSLSEQLMATQGEWQLVNISIFSYSFTKQGVSRSRLTYMVSIRRRPLLYVAIFVVPLFYLLILDLATFFISEACGEKLGFKVTILLSISVLLLILKDMLPSTEDTLPVIVTFCTVIFGLVGISVLEAMLVSFLLDLDSYCVCKEAPCSVDVHDVGTSLESSHHNETVANEEQGRVNLESHFSLDLPCDLSVLRQILEEVKAARQEAEGQGKARRNHVCYRRLARIIDNVFFTFYFLGVVTFLLCMYIIWIQCSMHSMH
ncbi:5-hydroxytryptamine receptor 3A-like isoform X1 [Betta splendens]|uniref:5-hydroxytryptamine receptor 3A-like isoform X1 n=1 Tax=Betta splendens TaxID=158456 RepID=A0A9W2XYZ7_BETSP|nr:5-hydroxytryptamine receptor 3A-like isoform X1 [Betta splendens]